METISRGNPCYRSKPLPPGTAARFAACLRANERFTRVQVVPSRSPGRSCVLFTPSHLGTQLEILRRRQIVREEHAADQAPDYEFILSAEGAFCWVVSPAGHVYETSRTRCNCPDYEFRCRDAGIDCKHIVMLRDGLATVRDLEAEAAAANPFGIPEEPEFDAYWPTPDPVEHPWAELFEPAGGWGQA